MPENKIFNSLVLFGCTVFLAVITLIRRNKFKSRRTVLEKDEGEIVIYPPFPPLIVKLLSSSSLCFLSTTDGTGNPHLSLMSFTFYKDEKKGDLLIFTTRENTKKFTHIAECPKVAILIHDFPHLKEQSNPGGGTASITLRGVALIEPDSRQEEYRAIHAARNPGYKQFIVGPDIRVVSVRIESASICDFQDQVTTWEAYS